MSKIVSLFILDKAHKQNLPPYQHKVCAHIWNISHTVSSLLHCDLQKNDQCRTNNQCYASLLTSNCQRKEQLGQWMECQKEVDPSKPFSSVFLKDIEEHLTHAD
jgi:hypothetical protein